MSVEVLGVKDVLSAEHAAKYGAALKSIEETFKEALNLFDSPEFASKSDWKKKSDQVFSKDYPNGKYFALRAELPGDVDTIFEDHWGGVNVLATWNPNIAFSKEIAKLSDHVNVIHYANKDILVVKGRDFVVIRMHRKTKDGFVTVGKSFPLADIPETKDHVRGEIIFGAGRFTKKDAKTTTVDYVMCIDLKGLIPKMVVDQFMSKMMMDDLTLNTKHVQELMSKK